jgi:glycosyltransferase involved in cell wall biosynthesis
MGRPVKVLHVITRMVRGGAQRVVLDLAGGLAELHGRGAFEVVLAAGEETGSEGSLWAEAEVLAARHGFGLVRVGPLVRDVRPVADVHAYFELRRLIGHLRPKVVHGHTSKAGLIACLAAKHERVRSVFSPHGHIMGDGAQIPGVPGRGLKRRVLGVAARMNSRVADALVAPNEGEKEDGALRGLWTREQCTVVPNGIDVGRFRPRDGVEARRAAGIGASAQVIGVVARLTSEKGVDIAVRAMRELPGVVLLVAGDGPERGALEGVAREASVSERVRFLGEVEAPEGVYAACDLLVVPSRSEAHGMVAGEAMACGLPVVAASVGGLAGFAGAGGCEMILPENPQALADAVRRLLGDEETRGAMARNGREYIERGFSREAMIAATAKLYRELLARESRE